MYMRMHTSAAQGHPVQHKGTTLCGARAPPCAAQGHPVQRSHLQLLDEVQVQTPAWAPDGSSSLWLYRVARADTERGGTPSTLARPRGTEGMDAPVVAAGVRRRASTERRRATETQCSARGVDDEQWPRDARRGQPAREGLLAGRKLGRRRRGGGANDAVRDAVARWSEASRLDPGENYLIHALPPTRI